jgi:hypothetical protein
MKWYTRKTLELDRLGLYQAKGLAPSPCGATLGYDAQKGGRVVLTLETHVSRDLFDWLATARRQDASPSFVDSVLHNLCCAARKVHEVNCRLKKSWFYIAGQDENSCFLEFVTPLEDTIACVLDPKADVALFAYRLMVLLIIWIELFVVRARDAMKLESKKKFVERCRGSAIQDLDMSNVFKFCKARYIIIAAAMRGEIYTMREFETGMSEQFSALL